MEKNLPWWYFVHHKSYTNTPGIELGPPQHEASYCLIYGMAQI
jgi:hypothetical protein